MRHALERNIGRIKSIEAPVVPIMDARMVPISRIIVLMAGDPLKVPLI